MEQFEEVQAKAKEKAWKKFCATGNINDYLSYSNCCATRYNEAKQQRGGENTHDSNDTGSGHQIPQYR